MNTVRMMLTLTIVYIQFNFIISQKILSFNDNNSKFKIIQFADIHYGEGEETTWGPIQDIESTQVMKMVLNQEYDANLVVFSGDQITGNNIK